MLKENPFSKNGMYSKAGGFSVQMYNLEQQKAEVLHNQKKSTSVPKNKKLNDLFRFKLLNRDNDMIQDFQKINHGQVGSLNLTPEKLEKSYFLKKHAGSVAQIEPFKKCVSRDYIELIKNKVNQSSTTSCSYKPKYHIILKKSPLNNDEQFEQEQRLRALSKKDQIKFPKALKSKPAITIKANEGENESIKDSLIKFKLLDRLQKSQSMITLPQCVTSRVMGSVDLNLQTKRFPFKTNDFDINERQFQLLKLPFKQNKNCGFFGQQTSRTELFTLGGALQYDPKYSQIYVKPDKLIPNFRTVTRRNSNSGLPPVYSCDESISQENVKAQQFDKQTKRFPYSNQTSITDRSEVHQYKLFFTLRDSIMKQK